MEYPNQAISTIYSQEKLSFETMTSCLIELLNFADHCEETQTEIPEQITSAIESIFDSHSEKIDSYTRYIRKLESEIDYFKGLIASEQSEINKRSKRIDWMKQTALNVLKRLNEKSMEGKAGGKISIRKIQSLDVTSLEHIPQLYLKTETFVTPDKNAIKEAIKNGASFEGVKIIEKESVTIK